MTSASNASRRWSTSAPSARWLTRRRLPRFACFGSHRSKVGTQGRIIALAVGSECVDWSGYETPCRHCNRSDSALRVRRGQDPSDDACGSRPDDAGERTARRLVSAARDCTRDLPTPKSATTRRLADVSPKPPSSRRARRWGYRTRSRYSRMESTTSSMCRFLLVLEVRLNISVMATDLTVGTIAARQARLVSTRRPRRRSGTPRTRAELTNLAVGTIYNATIVSFPQALLTASCAGNVAPFKSHAAGVLTALGQTSPSKVINVFYTERDPATRGETCADGNSAVIIIGKWNAAGETLAHELGHALSLCHPNDPGCYNSSPALPDENLMNSPSAQAAQLTTAQCFRANVNSKSVLNQLSIRTGATRQCAGTDSTLTCPPLSMHK